MGKWYRNRSKCLFSLFWRGKFSLVLPCPLLKLSSTFKQCISRLQDSRTEAPLFRRLPCNELFLTLAFVERLISFCRGGSGWIKCSLSPWLWLLLCRFLRGVCTNSVTGQGRYQPGKVLAGSAFSFSSCKSFLQKSMRKCSERSRRGAYSCTHYTTTSCHTEIRK